jgi:hypothetical protein
LLPKLLGALWEFGRPGSLAGSIEAKVSERLEIGSVTLGSNVLVIHAYLRCEADKISKVFSAHLVLKGTCDPRIFKNWEGQCAILSWRRGAWEDVLLASSSAPRTLDELFRFGLAATKH